MYMDTDTDTAKVSMSSADYTPKIDGIEFGEVYAKVREGLAEAELLDALRTASSLHRRSTWWLGDLLVYSEKVWDTYAEAAEATGYANGTLRNMASISKRVPRESRVAGLHWRTHRAVAALEPEEQRKWLSLALAKGMTSDEVASAVRNAGLGNSDELEDPVGDACVCPHCGGTGTVKGKAS